MVYGCDVYGSECQGAGACPCPGATRPEALREVSGAVKKNSIWKRAVFAEGDFAPKFGLPKIGRSGLGFFLCGPKISKGACGALSILRQGNSPAPWDIKKPSHAYCFK
jgi:hypothetical protein